MPLPICGEAGGGVGIDTRVPQPLRLHDGAQFGALLPELSLQKPYRTPFRQRSEENDTKKIYFKNAFHRFRDPCGRTILRHGNKHDKKGLWVWVAIVDRLP